MIITCDKCETKFMLDAEQLGDDGRKVRCGNCAHVWLQVPPKPEVVAEEREVATQQAENLKQVVQDKVEGVQPSLPTVIKKVPAPKWMQAAVLLLVVANALGFVVLNKDMIGQRSFYDMIGQYSTDNMVIADSGLLEPREVKGVSVYYANWTIQNNNKTREQMPSRRIRLMDKHMRLLSGGIDDEPIMLEAGEKREFTKIRVADERNKGKYLILEIGNPHELALR